MAHPYHHAVHSARLFGGAPEDYLAIHDWFDESKAHFADLRHRALRHHSEGIFLCQSTPETGSGFRTADHHIPSDVGFFPGRML